MTTSTTFISREAKTGPPGRADVLQGGGGLKRIDLAVLLLPALAKLLLQLFTTGGYGLNGDELYYLACSEHLDWGYVDHPPLSIFLLWLQRAFLGDSHLAIRFLPAVAGAATVLMTGLLARHLGAGRFGQFLAGLCALLAPLYLALHHIFSMNAFDTLFWVTALYLIARILDDGPTHLWLWLGVVIGFGLQNKISLLFLGAGLAAGLALTGKRRLLLEPRAWLGGLIAFLIFLPHILWQIAEGWPTLEFMHNAQTHKMLALPLPDFLKEQLLLMGPLLGPVWVVGLVVLFAHRSLRQYRTLGWCYLALFAFYVLQKGKPYYLGTMYPVLFAAGAFALEQWARRAWARTTLSAVLAVGTLATLPLALPVLPVDTYIRYSEALGLRPSSGERFDEGALPSFYANMFGWQKLTAVVDSVYRSLPPEEQARCAIVGQNYMQAGAVDFYGREYGLPQAMAPHNSYWLWGRDRLAAQGPGRQPISFIIIGDEEKNLRQVFEEVELRARFDDDYIQPIHRNKPVYVARRPKVPLLELWTRARVYI